MAKKKQMNEADADADQRIDQPLAQLDQMIHQRRLGGLDLVVPLRIGGVAPAGPLTISCTAQAPLFSGCVRPGRSGVASSRRRRSRGQPRSPLLGGGTRGPCSHVLAW